MPGLLFFHLQKFVLLFFFFLLSGAVFSLFHSYVHYAVLFASFYFAVSALTLIKNLKNSERGGLNAKRFGESDERKGSGTERGLLAVLVSFFITPVFGFVSAAGISPGCIILTAKQS